MQGLGSESPQRCLGGGLVESCVTSPCSVCGCAISSFLEEAVISSLNCQKVPFGGLRFINQALKQ